MAIVPAVYVTIEDRSFALPSVEATRTGFCVILCDRGEHNKVVQIDSVQEFQTLYGKPDKDKTGLSHYLADKFLQYGARLYVVRPVLIDSKIETENAAIANRFIKYNDPAGSSQVINGGYNPDTQTSLGFKFWPTLPVVTDDQTNPPTITQTQLKDIVVVSLVAYEQFEVGDFIYSIVDGVSQIVQIAAKDFDTLWNVYVFRLAKDYVFHIPGPNEPDTITPSINIFAQNAYKFYPGGIPVAYTNASGVISDGQYSYINASNAVTCLTKESFDAISIGDWIYPRNQTGGTVVNMRQVISKRKDEITQKYQLTLDSVYTGTTTTDPVIGEALNFYEPFTLETQNNIRSEDNFDITDSDNLWYFYAIGPGKYYNELSIIGTRSVRYEKLYLNTDGTPMYPFAFLDIYIQYANADGTTTILEGPFTCTIMRQTLTGSVIRDINTGEELYIENIINLHSKYIRCKTTNSAAHQYLMTNESNKNGFNPETYRLYIQNLFANEKVFRTNVIANKGIKFESGEDGVQYDQFGRLNLDNGKIKGLVINTFRNTLVSVDNSVGNTQNVTYPWFKFDYIISGGYDKDIQAAARELADLRNDALLLADTGSYVLKPETDIEIRQNDMAWNTWNAIIYTGYREIFDPYTGRRIWMTPVYHAIERHLFVDANYWISEPVAGIEKGAIADPIKLAYKPNVKDLEDLIENELNATIIEPDGVYILTQFTTYKRLSVMKRANTVKFIHYLRKEIPTLLKDILQRKFTQYWIGLAKSRLDGFMTKFVTTGNGSERYASISTYTVTIEPDEARSELNVILSIKPLRTIEAIHVNIIVN